jgi:hypothetical protein
MCHRRCGRPLRVDGGAATRAIHERRAHLARECQLVLAFTGRAPFVSTDQRPVLMGPRTRCPPARSHRSAAGKPSVPEKPTDLTATARGSRRQRRDGLVALALVIMRWAEGNRGVKKSAPVRHRRSNQATASDTASMLKAEAQSRWGDNDH